ncbi:MAG: molybdenum cofactor guanylyltransferase [Planctomycetota bacterium]
MSKNQNFVGIVLAGGRSTRMGNDKASLQIAGQTMLGRVTALLQSMPACRTVFVVAAEKQLLPQLPEGVRILNDRAPHRGPLEGFATALSVMKQDPCIVRSCFLTSCDAPFLAAPFVTSLVGACQNDVDAAVPVYEGFPQPISAAYSADIIDVVDDLLAHDEKSMKTLLTRIRCRYVDAESLRDADPELLSLRNLNTPADFAWAVQKVARQ